MKIRAAMSTSIIVTVGLTGCGGSTEDLTPDQKLTAARKPYFEQKVAWRPCDGTALGAFEKAAKSPRLRCAEVRVPMDWGNPARGDITVAVTRLAVKDPARRVGSLLFNPGGPGGDGIAENLKLLYAFNELWSHSSATSAERQVISQYDLVGFSIRGIGSSTQLTCGSNERLTTVLWGGNTDPATVDALLRNAELKSKACQKNALAPYINTEQIARDMNLIRAVLGDAKLNYIGHSYGTWLGAWYAGLFPEHTGRMVLSSNLDFSAPTFAESGILQQPPAMQRVADQVMAQYAARHDAYFNLGTSPDAARQQFAALSPALKAATSLALDKSRALQLSGYIDEGVSVFVAAKGVQQLLEQHPGGTQEQIVALAKQHVLSRHATANRMALDIATKSLVPRYFEAKQPLTPEKNALHMSTEAAVDLAVICNDTPALSNNKQFWIDKHAEYAAQYPLGNGILGGSVLNFSCLFWKPPQSAVIKPTIDKVARAPSILMIQRQFDGPTAAEGALRMFDKLPNARLIYIKDEYSHAGFPIGSPCVDEPVIRYLLDGTLPPRRVDCAGQKLRLDGGQALEHDEGAPVLNRAAGMSAQESGGETREEIIRGIHEVMRPRS
ncbi:alpha/beta fold hydrolase [Paraburkholderia fungorum]|uniref:alpha/beta fold hydrolase n=1 Tax=Paraburkholderia fungorum TaxID=134537 RepID=UPI0038B82B64